MSFDRSVHLGGATVMGNASSGTHYYSHSFPAAHQKCWMELSVYRNFPLLPSLLASHIQQTSGSEKFELLQTWNVNNTKSNIFDATNTTVPADKSVENALSKTSTKLNKNSCTTNNGSLLKCVCETIRLEIELFNDIAPMTCDNFSRLCDGVVLSTQSIHQIPLVMRANFDSSSWDNDKPQEVFLSYKGTHFHKIIPHFIMEGGDVTLNRCKQHNCRNYLNSYGRGWFDDENKQLRFNQAGLLGMANNGPNSNGTQFFITTSAKEERALNGRHVCFGRVVVGLEELLKQVQAAGNVSGTPNRYVVITDCGSGPLPPLCEECEQEEESEFTMTNGTDNNSSDNNKDMEKNIDEAIDSESVNINAPVQTKRIKQVSYKVEEK